MPHASAGTRAGTGGYPSRASRLEHCLMSGPVTDRAADAVQSRGTEGEVVAFEIIEGREAMIGAVPVRRILPQRRRRTVGAWCFLDHIGPVDIDVLGDGIAPHPHIGLQTVTWLVSGE